MISKEQVEHIAKLARIELTEKEKEKFTKDLSSILNYVEKLNQIDTSDVKQLAQAIELDSATREDEREKNDSGPMGGLATRDKLLRETPKRKGDYVKVPKILE